MLLDTAKGINNITKTPIAINICRTFLIITIVFFIVFIKPAEIINKFGYVLYL